MSTDKRVKNQLPVSLDKGIVYLKELRSKAKSINSCILMQRLDHYFDQKPDGFYKFLEPSPGNQEYQEGNSWTEDLNFSAEEFRTAFSNIGITYNSKTSFQQAENKFLDTKVNEEKFYCSYLDRISKLTFYFRNHSLVDSFLDTLILQLKKEA